MAAQSDNKYDVYNWIIKVYDSCESVSQLLTVYKLVQNFRNMYDDYKLYSELDDYYFEASERLMPKVDKKTRKKLLKG
jgi:hypothetical protein